MLTLAVSNSFGVYAYQTFIEHYSGIIANPKEVEPEMRIIRKGPEHEDYIYSWSDFVTQVKIKEDLVLQENDGDIWIGTPEEMEEAFGND